MPMNKKTRKKRTAFLLCLLLMLPVFLRHPSQVQAADGGPQIPFGQDVQNYDPERDGYYAYLQMNYPSDTQTAPETGQEDARTEGYLPVLVWNNAIYANARDFETVSGASAVVKGEKICLQILNRRLYLTEGSTQAVFTLGNAEQPYSSRICTLHAAPFALDNIIWFPLQDALGILGYDRFFEADDAQEACRITLPAKDAYDILADLSDTEIRSGFLYGQKVFASADAQAKQALERMNAVEGILRDDSDDPICAALYRLQEASGTAQNAAKQAISAELRKHETARELLETLRGAAAAGEQGTGTALRDSIRTAVSFLEACAASAQEDTSEELLSDLTVLQETAALEDAELPVGPLARIEQQQRRTDADLLEKVIPLYVTVKGNVRNGIDDAPVEDVQCTITIQEKEAGTFTGAPGGSYRVNVPVARPEGIAELSPYPGLVSASFDFSSPTVEGEEKQFHMCTAGAEEELKDVSLGSFDWYRCLQDEILPETQLADLQEKQASVTSSDAAKKAGWSNREGVLGAEVRDMTFDGREDLILFRFEKSEEDAGYTLYADFYTEEKGAVTMNAHLPLCAFDGISYRSCRAGIVDVSEVPYLWVECNENAYFGDGAGFTADFYGWDGKAFRKIWLNGRTDGGSSGTAYSFCTYNDDGSFDKIILYADSTFWYQNREAEGNSPKLASAGEALETGYYYLGLPDPKKTDYENAGWSVYKGWFVGDQFPTYWDTATVRKCVEVCTSGSKSFWNWSTRQMTDSVRDYTMLTRYLDAEN